MSAIGLKSISGITSITTPAGVDDQLTLHTNNTTERLKIDVAGNVHVNNHLAVTGITTFSDDIIIGADNKKLKLGAGEELELYQAGNHSIIQHNGGNFLLLRSNSFGVQNAAGTKNIFQGFGDTHSSMYYNGSYKIRTQNTGAEIVGTVVATGADINGDLDVDGHTNLDNVNIAGVTTSAGNIYADNYFGNSGLTLNNNGNPSVNLTSTSTGGSSRIHFGDPDSGVVGKIYYIHSTDYMYFATAYGERLRIDSSGKVIIGDTSSDAQLGVYRASYNIAEFCNTNADATGAEVALRKDSSSPADGDTLGILKFIGDNDAGEKINYAYIRSKSGDVSDGTEDGYLEFYTRGAGTLGERLRITSDGKMGLGISNPTGQFAVSDGTRIAEINPHSSGTFIGNRSNHPVLFQVNASEKVRIDTDGRLLVGTSSNVAGGAINSKIQVRSASYDAAIAIVANRSNTAGGNLSFTKTRGTSEGDTTIVQDGDTLGTINFFGADGSADEANGASIYAVVNGTPGVNDMPGRLVFATTGDGAASPTERLRIDSSGRLLVSGALGFGNLPFGGNSANAAIQIRCNSKYNGIAFGENAVSGCIGLGGADTTTAMVFTANAHPANLGGGTKDIFEWWSGNAGGGGPGKYMTLDTGGHLALTSGNLEFANGNGIDFSAVPDGGRSISTDGNKLDDYEEGTYVPTTNTNLTLQGSYDIFAYIKVGRMCTVRGLFYPNNNPSGNYAMTFSLPFAAYNYSQIAGAGGSGVMHRYISGASNGVAVYIEDGASNAKFYKNGGSGGWGPVYNTDWNTAMEIYIDVTYFTA